MQVKRNQGSLHDEAQRTIAGQAPLDTFEEHERCHGRHSSWHVSVFDASSSAKADEWAGLRRFVHVHKRTVKGGRASHCDRLYISDLWDTSAERYHRGIRGHWTIENSLHWVMDVVHGEDANRITRGCGPVNRAVFSAIAINLHRANGSRSVTENQTIFGANVKELFKFIRT